MKKILNNTIQLLAVAMVMTLACLSLSSCRDAREKEFDNLLVNLAESDGEIDFNDWAEITEFIDANKARLGKFVSDGEIDAEAVKEYISQFFQHRHPSQEIAFNGAGNASEFLAVKFYLERSGSMVPYDSPQGRGEFKSAIVSMLNNLPGNPDDNTIFVVNDGVFPYPNSFKQFITDQNIFETTRGIGNPGYTDFGCILDSVLNRNGDNDLSILVTDMIYSTKDVGVVNTEKIFTEAQGMTHAVFKDKAADKAMVIAQMEGSYIGQYYPYNQPQGVAYSGVRPFYIVVVGNNENIARLTRSDRYKDFADLRSLSGFQHVSLFSASGIYKPFYSFLLADSDIKGRFKADRKRSGEADVKAVTDLKPDRDSGDTQLVVALDLGGMFVEDSYLMDKNNYRIEADEPVEIVSIAPIEQSDITPTNKDIMAKATHRMVLKLGRITHAQDICITLLNKFPQWIEASSSDDDSAPSAADLDFPHTTFGLKYLLRGIYESYAKQTDEPFYFKMELGVGN